MSSNPLTGSVVIGTICGLAHSMPSAGAAVLFGAVVSLAIAAIGSRDDFTIE